MRSQRYFYHIYNALTRVQRGPFVNIQKGWWSPPAKKWSQIIQNRPFGGPFQTCHQIVDFGARGHGAPQAQSAPALRL